MIVTCDTCPPGLGDSRGHLARQGGPGCRDCRLSTGTLKGVMEPGPRGGRGEGRADSESSVREGF